MKKHSILYKFYMLYMLVIVSSLVLAVFLTNSSFKSGLISEKQTSMQKEGQLIARQYARDYFSGKVTDKQLSRYFSEIQSLINTQIWLCDLDGNIVITSENSKSFESQSIYKYYEDFNINRSFQSSGVFYGAFAEPMVTIGRSISLSGKRVGYIILHSSMSPLLEQQEKLNSTLFLGFGMLIIATLIPMIYLSRKFLIPIEDINLAARKYATGDFSSTIPITKNDEMGELAISLNFMATEISKLDEYRNNFIANISHDLRSPLTSIKGYLEAILDDTIPPELYQKYIKIVLAETQRLTKLTASLTSLNSMHQSGLILTRTDFDLLAILNNMRNTFEVQCLNRGITIEFATALTPCMVNADKIRIEQVIYNLLDNAIKFSYKNSTIKISITEVGKDKVLISVKDSGIGIAKEDQRHIWDRFYKADHSRGKDKSGHGIGLSITKDIIKAHQENIQLISTKGVGSEFLFSLPKSK